MTLSRRDEFAKAVMSGLMGAPNSALANWRPETVANECRRRADALVEELDRTAPKPEEEKVFTPEELRSVTGGIVDMFNANTPLSYPYFKNIGEVLDELKTLAQRDDLGFPVKRPEVEDDGREILCASGDGTRLTIVACKIGPQMWISGNVYIDTPNARLFALRILKLCDEIEGK